MFRKRAVLKVIVIRRIRKKLQARQRSMYVRPIFLRRDSHGESTLALELASDPQYHFKYFRMDKQNYDEIFAKIKPKLTHSQTHQRPIPAFQRLAMTIRYLATGNSQISMGLSYRVSPSAIGKILRETLAAICEALEDEHLPPPDEMTWTQNQEDFAEIWNFPNACGALDGKHIRIKAPRCSGSQFFNYKSYFSIVLLAICNARYMFTATDIGSSGSESDGGILMRSNMGKRLNTGTLGLPSPKPVGNTTLPHVILGDSGFPLKPNLMTPYKGEFIEKEKRIFNYRLSRARMVVENSFGILAARWRIFQTPINADEDFVKLVTKTCVILHNFLMRKKDFNTITADRFEDGIMRPGSWRETTQHDQSMTPLQIQGSSNYSGAASEIRSEIAKYFMTIQGRLEWQERR